MKLRSGCVLHPASYFTCIKSSYFEALVDCGPPVLFLGQNYAVALEVFLCMSPFICLAVCHVTEQAKELLLHFLVFRGEKSSYCWFPPTSVPEF